MTEPRKKTYIHTYVMLLLRDKGLSQTALAIDAGCSLQAVNQVLLGKSESAQIKSLIAHTLGYDSWQRLSDAALFFSDNFASMYNYPTEQRNSTGRVKKEEVAHVG